jgi:hypothetical protein
MSRFGAAMSLAFDLEDEPAEFVISFQSGVGDRVDDTAHE